MVKETYTPDILNCFVNLSENEVFTPPTVVNELLDILPSELWSNGNIKFLDPCCKTGIFLREIAKRLIIGLESTFPDFDERINHIMTEQLYGIGLSELSTLMSRRTVYCSKNINHENSIVKELFENDWGNIFYEPIPHEFNNNNICIHCGFKKPSSDIELELDFNSHPFLHKDLQEIFGKMKFDVIIGNPPYQIKDGGAASSAKPLYHKFIEQAKKLDPKYITMIIPARWYAGGKGLNEFRNEMLTDERISVIHDFPTTSDCFTGLKIRGGICYFLWDKHHKGDCTVFNHKDNKIISKTTRPLLENNENIFIRYNMGVEILKKVQSKNEKTMDKLVSPRKPFGLATNFSGGSEKKSDKNNILLYKNRSKCYVSNKEIERNQDWLKMYKVIIPYSSPGTDDYPHEISAKPFVIGPNSACTETYLVISPTDNEEIANNIVNYIKTQFFRFLLNLSKSSLHITKDTYRFVPQQNFTKSWSDEDLYEKYNINEDEIEFINSIVKRF